MENMFRAVNKETNELAYGYYCEVGGIVYIIKEPTPMTMTQYGSCLPEEDFIDVYPDSIAMNTGELDKNNDNIYGSIKIRGKMTKGGDKVKWCQTIWDIIFIDGCFGFGIDKRKTSIHSRNLGIQCYHKTVEIIGTQYDDEVKI